jgi:hypothetical protein
MIFFCDHPELPDMPKGIKQVPTEHGLWTNNLCMQYKQLQYQCKQLLCKKIWISNQISKTNDLLLKRWLRLQDICASFCQNFTASSTLLSFLGALWRDIFVKIVTHLQHFKKIFQRLWLWLASIQFGVGNIRWSNGWMHTTWGLVLRMLKQR